MNRANTAATLSAACGAGALICLAFGQPYQVGLLAVAWAAFWMESVRARQ